MSSSDLLFNPNTYDPAHFDDETRRLLRATIDWFEQRGKVALLEDHHGDVFYADFLEFPPRSECSRRCSPRPPTPAATPTSAGTPPQRRLQRDHRLLRIRLLVRVASHDPRARPDLAVREPAHARPRRRPARRRRTVAFGLSEQDHGADIYNTDMILTPDGDGGCRANGGKYYIGNGRPRRDGVGVRPPRRRRRPRGLRLLRGRQSGADL